MPPGSMVCSFEVGCHPFLLTVEINCSEECMNIIFGIAKTSLHVNL